MVLILLSRILIFHFKGAMTIYNLLQKGKDIIPPNKWHKTPVALKATAGLRLLPKKASKQLLKEV